MLLSMRGLRGAKGRVRYNQFSRNCVYLPTQLVPSSRSKTGTSTYVVGLSFRQPSVCLKSSSIVLSQKYNNESCFVCDSSQNYAFLVTLIPLRSMR